MISPTLISFVARSKRRTEILLALKERGMTQPEIRKRSNMYKSHVSRSVSELTNKKLIVCLNQKDREFKFYKITELGKKVITEVKRITN